MLQNQTCEACGECMPTDSDKRIDHSHATGAVRGVLCDRCNRVLGLCREDPDVFAGLCNYIAKTSGVDYRTQPYV